MCYYILLLILKLRTSIKDARYFLLDQVTNRDTEYALVRLWLTLFPRENGQPITTRRPINDHIGPAYLSFIEALRSAGPEDASGKPSVTTNITQQSSEN